MRCFSLFDLGGSQAQKSVPDRDVRIDRSGFYLVISIDGLRLPIDGICCAEGKESPVADEGVVNDSQAVPIQRIHHKIAGVANHITTI